MEEKSTNPDKKPEKTMPSTLMFSHHFRVSFMVAMINLVTIGLLGYGGYQLDLAYNTKPVLTIVGVLLSFPVAQVILYRWIQRNYIPYLKSRTP